MACLKTSLLSHLPCLNKVDWLIDRSPSLRLAFKSSSIFFHEREARAVDFLQFLCFLRQKASERAGANYRNRKWEAKVFEKAYPSFRAKSRQNRSLMQKYKQFYKIVD